MGFSNFFNARTTKSNLRSAAVDTLRFGAQLGAGLATFAGLTDWIAGDNVEEHHVGPYAAVTPEDGLQLTNTIGLSLGAAVTAGKLIDNAAARLAGFNSVDQMKRYDAIVFQKVASGQARADAQEQAWSAVSKDIATVGTAPLLDN